MASVVAPAVTVSLSNGRVVVVSAVSMCRKKVRVARAPGRERDGLADRVRVGGAVTVHPGLPRAAVGGLAGTVLPITPAVAVHGRCTGLEARVRRSCGPAQPPAPPIVHVKAAEAVEPSPSRAVAVTANVPAAVGVPEISPVAALTVSPLGRPVAE